MRLYSSLFVVFLFLYSTPLSAQKAHALFCASHPSMIQQYALSTKSMILHRLVVKDISQRIVRDRIVDGNACPLISTSPFFVKEGFRISKRQNRFRTIESKHGNVTGRITNTGLAMRFYITRYYISQI